MKSIKCKLNDFEFDRFVKDMMRFFLKITEPGIHPSACISQVKKPGNAPEFSPDKGRNTFMKELESGLWLFFPFCGPNVGEPFLCADGKSRKLEDDKDFCLGDVDTAGYLLGLKKDRLIIHSAIQSLSCMPVASMDIVRKCGPLEKPMVQFIKQYLPGGKK